MLEGLRSQIYQVADLAAAKAWYTTLLGTPPYFDEPFYVGFNIGGYELGLLPSEENAGSVTYWGVPEADSAYARLLELGASARQPIEDVGGGIRLGTVTAPQGGVLGVIENPHFAVE
jgi:predicted enzyme related to lactoylglutathione lyase